MLHYIASGDEGARDLYIVQGPGSFGRQVAEGPAMMALRLGIRAVPAEPGEFPPSRRPREWDLFSAGVFEQDAELVAKSLRLPDPRAGCARWPQASASSPKPSTNPEGVFGIAQWFPGSWHEVLLGPREEEFLRAHAASGGGLPDYPAAQAAARAVIAANCASLAGSTNRDDLWAAATDLETSTLFGRFKINPQSGAQVSHRTVLVRWTDGKPAPVILSAQAAGRRPAGQFRGNPRTEDGQSQPTLTNDVRTGRPYRLEQTRRPRQVVCQ